MTALDWQIGVTGDAEIREHVSPDRQVHHMIRAEAAFSRALGNVGGVAPDVGERAAACIEAAVIDGMLLQEQARSDGLPVPGLVAQLKEQLAPDLHVALHAGLTSQDVMDTALMLTLGACFDLFQTRLRQLDARLQALIDEVGDVPMMGRTRLQVALPIRIAERLNSWRAPLKRHAAALETLRIEGLAIQMGGPVGNGDSFGVPVEPLRRSFAEQLGLADVPAWHTDRSRIQEMGAWCARLSGTLGKMGHDVALMAQQGLDEVHLASGGQSSAMPHKKNPVLAEVLVALSRDASVQLGALNLAMEHEQERSGAAWTLEWMVLPRLLEAVGAGLLRATTLAETLSFPMAPDDGR